MSGMLVAEKLRSVLPLVFDEVINLLEKSLLLGPICRSAYFTPRSAIFNRAAGSLQRLMDLGNNSAHTKKMKVGSDEKASEQKKREARSLETMRSIGATYGYKIQGQTSSVQCSNMPLHRHIESFINHRDLELKAAHSQIREAGCIYLERFGKVYIMVSTELIFNGNL